MCCMKANGEMEVELHASNSGAVGRVTIYTVCVKCKYAYIKL